MKQTSKESHKQSTQRPQTASYSSSNSAQKQKIAEDEIIGEEELMQKLKYEQEFKVFENYRSYLLQYQFLNATLKDKMKKQQNKLEIEFTDRLQQLKDIIDCNIQLQTKILRERAINTLEEVLQIEYKNYKEIFSKLDEFSDYANNLQEFLNGSVKKVYIESGLSIDIDQVNLYINESSELIQKIIEKHNDFFKEYPQIAQMLSEIIQESLVQIKAIKQIDSFLQEIKQEQDAKIEEKAKEEYFRSKGFGVEQSSDYQNVIEEVKEKHESDEEQLSNYQQEEDQE